MKKSRNRIPHNYWTKAFFFSSRRRHTRLTCDWSSDVCSSDLWIRNCRRPCSPIPSGSKRSSATCYRTPSNLRAKAEIGRASCRERARSSGVAVGIEKKELGVEEWKDSESALDKRQTSSMVPQR